MIEWSIVHQVSRELGHVEAAAAFVAARPTQAPEPQLAAAAEALFAAASAELVEPARRAWR